jgi:type IV pilus assembly protein PilB
MVPIVEKIAGLRNIGLFNGLSREDLEKVAGKVQEKVYPSNTVILKEGSPGDYMFFVRTGEVEVKKREATLGIDLAIARLGPGDCFGEMALLTGRPRAATVTATQATTLFLLLKTDFEGLVSQHPSISISLNKVLANRIEETDSQRGLGFASLARLRIDRKLLQLLPKHVMTQFKVLPVAFSRNTLTLAMVDPGNLPAMDEVRKLIKGVAIEPVIVTQEDHARFLKDDYPLLAGETAPGKVESESPPNLNLFQSEFLDDLQAEDDTKDIGIVEEEAEGAPIVRLTNSIIAYALKKGASDIHIEPMERNVRVRYRVDGILQEGQVLPKKVLLPLVSRIKIVSRLDITERRLPQDGRISQKEGQKSVDFRISTIPTKYGEKAVMRILDKGNASLGLDRFITHKPVLKLVREMIRQPYGIIYVTGPTGSGKTTTLYSALAELNKKDINISTVEDPVEYDLEGINQVQVNADIGLDFARVLRAFLRQDPDIMLVGETRDAGTAKITIEAALTGHLVFTTLHANDAPGACTRLTDMGVEPFLISSSIIGVIAQRLVRQICRECIESYMPEAAAADYLGIPRGVTLYRGRGCESCGFTGYGGRIAVFEVLRVSESIRRLVAERHSAREVREEAIKSGMITLKEYSLILLREGYTTVDEVLRTVIVQS